MDTFRDWKVLDTIPDGWVVDKTAGSPLPRSVFITNGKSVFNGQQRAILKVARVLSVDVDIQKIDIIHPASIKKQVDLF